MQQSNFSFLEDEFPVLFNLATSAEYNLHADPVTSLFKLRLLGEKLVAYVFETHHLELTYDDTFHRRIKLLEEEGLIQQNVANLIHTIKHKGNIAVHQSKGTIEESKTVLFSSFKLCKWFYETYSETPIDITEVRFSPPKNLDARHALHLLEQEYAELEKKFNKILAEKEAIPLNDEKKAEINQRSEIAARKVDLTEAETRELIDAQLKQAGWDVDTLNLNYKSNKTVPEAGKNMAIAEWPVNGKWADYALFIGTDLYGIVEAKKYANDISTDLRQSKVYAEHVEAVQETKLIGKWDKYKVPFLFSTNGRPYLEQIKTKSGIWFLDVRRNDNRAKALQAWYSPQGLKDLYERDSKAADQKLQKEEADYLQQASSLGLRNYQIKAIKKVEEAVISNQEQRRALLAMATGTGKTRTIMGLCYRLIKANRFKRILFLVDRTVLGLQALNAFKDNKVEDLNTFAEIYQVEELGKMIPDIDTRLHFATVQSLVKRLFYADPEEGAEVPTIDTYDCIIVDEAHRGYLMDKEMDEEDLGFKNQMDFVSKYRKVLEYFDAFKIGLTATPALHTIEIFGKPVFNYSYREAVIDGYLIDHEPPYIIKTKLGEEGIIWKKGEKPKGYDKEANEIVELDELEDELKIEIEGFNKQVLAPNFNRTVIQQLVNELDPESDEKTLIFAATDVHADLIVQLLKDEFENIGVNTGDDSIVKITGKAYDVEELIKRYKNEKYPSIAVTVDLLTTGVDVPPICNIVFMRRVKSRILYEQMLGRATRRCDEIGKEIFRIYDAVKIYEALEEFTNMKPVMPNPQTSFSSLVEEIEHIESEERLQKQVEQIIVKLQRKKQKISGRNLDQFTYASGGKDPESYIQMLRELTTREAIAQIKQTQDIWMLLDEMKPSPTWQLLSDHPDEAREMERGYGKAKKPEDYIESFRQYVLENLNKVAAMKLICTKPSELDRNSLKALYLELDKHGFTDLNLRQAWKASKNEEIAADIISFIRTMALGSELVDHETRIKKAVDKIRQMKDWNKVQQKWLSRFEMQLIKETVLRKEDLDKPPFTDDGGYQRLNKIFDEQLETILEDINKNLYTETA